MERRSLPAWEAWIEIHGPCHCLYAVLSLPAWEAWIEIAGGGPLQVQYPRRSPHGKRGLKYRWHYAVLFHPCRSPHGKRGLKYDGLALDHILFRRSPHGKRGLKSVAAGPSPRALVAPRMGSVD